MPSKMILLFAFLLLIGAAAIAVEVKGSWPVAPGHAISQAQVSK